MPKRVPPACSTGWRRRSMGLVLGGKNDMSDVATVLEETWLQMAVGGVGETLVPVTLEAQEAISAPFEITVEFVSDAPRLDADAFLYHPILITAQRNAPTPRYFHGSARRFTTLGPDGRGNWHYAVEIVPQIWFMSQAENCRFFENRSVKDIVSSLLANIGVQFAFRLIEAPAVREYTVQYNETDLAFVSRLLEEAGYFYFFHHTAAGHEMVIADSNIAFQPIPDGEVTYDPGLPRYDALNRLHAWKATATGQVTLDDYDPSGVDKPQAHTESTILATSGANTRTVYHWPALALDNGELTARVRRRMEAAEAFAALVDGSGWNEGFVPGGSFTLAEDPLTGRRDAVFVIRSVAHHAVSPYHWGSDSRDAAPGYSNDFSAFPTATTWRQPLSVPRPHMAGVFAAVVIGPGGEEIYHDDLARVKVRFPWSHLDDTTPGGALWVRVMKSWAGGGWGTQFIPRIGTEVAVCFVDGDPDRPMVIGAMYNAGSDPLYDPSEKNKTGWRSRSTLGGGSSNYSEFTMDDSIGAERIFLHAERDYVAEVEHDHNLTVDNCRVVTVKVDEQRTIGQNQTTKIGLNEAVSVGNNTTRTIGNDYLTKVGNIRNTTVGTDDSLSVGANRTTTIGTNHLFKAGANQTTTIGADDTLTIGANQATTIGAGESRQVASDQVLKVGGAQSVTIGSGQSVQVGAAQVVQVGSGHMLTATSGDIGLMADTGNIALTATAGSVGITAAELISLSVGPSQIAITPLGIQFEAITIGFDGVMVSFLSVLWSVLGVLAMIEGALVTINMGVLPGGGGGGAVEAEADAAAAVANATTKAEEAADSALVAASDMQAAVIKGAVSAAMRSQFGDRAASGIEAAGAAFGKVSAALSKAKSAVSGAASAAHDAEMAGRAAAVPYVEKLAEVMEAGYWTAIVPTRYEDKSSGEDSLNQTVQNQQDQEEDPEATINLAPRQSPQGGRSGGNSGGGSGGGRS